MDEAKLLELVKADFPEEVRGKIIKTYEYVDKNALEEAMYRGEVNEELTAKMAKCMNEKTELRLNVRVAKSGGAKNEN